MLLRKEGPKIIDHKMPWSKSHELSKCISASAIKKLECFVFLIHVFVTFIFLLCIGQILSFKATYCAFKMYIFFFSINLFPGNQPMTLELLAPCWTVFLFIILFANDIWMVTHPHFKAVCFFVFFHSVNSI